MRLHELAQHRVDRLAHLRPVTLQAIGQPGDVKRREQRDVRAPLHTQGDGVDAVVVKEFAAVDGGHQRRGVAHNNVVC